MRDPMRPGTPIICVNLSDFVDVLSANGGIAGLRQTDCSIENNVL